MSDIVEVQVLKADLHTWLRVPAEVVRMMKLTRWLSNDSFLSGNSVMLCEKDAREFVGIAKLAGIALKKLPAVESPIFDFQRGLGSKGNPSKFTVRPKTTVPQVGVSEFARDVAGCLHLLQQNGEILLMKRGKPVARLLPTVED